MKDMMEGLNDSYGMIQFRASGLHLRFIKLLKK